jgi:hypothetical protein
MTDETLPDPPPGFVRSSGRGQFSTHNGPYFHKPAADGVVFQAFYALPRHTNGIGLVHGGMLSAFTDGLRPARWDSEPARWASLFTSPSTSCTWLARGTG